ncbi:MAG: hypothetical protein Q9209_002194 [Squamulea sp. 1 TL-2023]
MSSTQSTPNLSSIQSVTARGPVSPKAPRKAYFEPYRIPGEISPRNLKRKNKSEDLRIENLWGEYIDEKVEQHTRLTLLQKMVLDVHAEYTEGEALPSEDAISLVQFAKSAKEKQEDMRREEKKKIKKQVSFRIDHEEEMESLHHEAFGMGILLRSGRQIRGSR